MPCRDEHPILISLSENKNLDIIGLNYKDKISNAEKFLNELGNPYKEILLDQDGTRAIEWGAFGVPETFLIYQNRIVKKYIGPLNQNSFEEIEQTNQMKISKFIFLFLILFSFNSLNADEDKLKTEITKNLRCLVCQGQSVYDSDSEFAVSLKLVVENKIQQGLTEDQIYKFLTDKYGEWILYDPKFNKNTYLLWFLPLLILLLGGAIIVKKLIKIKK